MTQLSSPNSYDFHSFLCQRRDKWQGITEIPSSICSTETEWLNCTKFHVSNVCNFNDRWTCIRLGLFNRSMISDWNGQINVEGVKGKKWRASSYDCPKISVCEDFTCLLTSILAKMESRSPCVLDSPSKRLAFSPVSRLPNPKNPRTDLTGFVGAEFPPFSTPSGSRPTALMTKGTNFSTLKHLNLSLKHAKSHIRGHNDKKDMGHRHLEQDSCPWKLASQFSPQETLWISSLKLWSSQSYFHRDGVFTLLQDTELKMWPSSSNTQWTIIMEMALRAAQILLGTQQFV